MKKNVLLTIVASMCAIGLFAQTQVNLSKISNPITNSSLLPTAAGVLIWGDYNNDGFLDAFISAGQELQDATVIYALYKNNGDGTFTSMPLSRFYDLKQGSAVWIDYDNDGNLDLILTGLMYGVPAVFAYKNSGAPEYELEPDPDVEEVLPSVVTENQDNNHPNQTICAFDYNNDGWVDLLITGSRRSESDWNNMGRVVALFKNNHGTFEFQATPVNGENFRNVNGGAVHAGDVNNDGYADILISGWADDASNGVTNLYINNKNGGFTRATQPNFTGHQEGNNVFLDVNNDGWMDIIEIGRDLKNGWNGFANLFINEQGSGWTKSSPFSGGSCPGMTTGDINNDGYMDLFVAGYATNCKILYGRGDGTFLAQELSTGQGARGGYLNFVDLNNDNSLDLTVYGYSDGFGFLNDWYIASGVPENTPPNAPVNAKARYVGDQYILTWDDATDDHTSATTMRYNVKVVFPGGKQYTYVPSDINTGKVKLNNACEAFLTVKSFALNLPQADYSFGVQAIDQAGMGSAWANIAAVSINNIASAHTNVTASNKQININSNEMVSYQIMSVTGQIIASGVSANVNQTVQSGVYLVKTVQNGAVHTAKILVY